MTETLTIATEGCCKGHPCDNCKTCQNGRCCRRDNPDYKLPALGDWHGPIYGELGVLNDDGEKVECHCCGEWYVALGNHAWLVHNLYADEYKSIFGLYKRHGLTSRAYHQRLSELTTDQLSRVRTFDSIRALTPEQRSDIGHRPRRLATILQMKGLQDPVTCSVNAKKAHAQGKRPAGITHCLGVKQHNKRWSASIKWKGKSIYLGMFATEEEAGRAYDAKARKLYGDKARLNFPQEQSV